MTITHETVIGEDGKPSAALIPWSEFLRIKKLLGVDDEEVTSEEAEAMREAEEDRRSGNTEASPT